MREEDQKLIDAGWRRCNGCHVWGSLQTLRMDRNKEKTGWTIRSILSTMSPYEILLCDFCMVEWKRWKKTGGILGKAWGSKSNKQWLIWGGQIRISWRRPLKNMRNNPAPNFAVQSGLSRAPLRNTLSPMVAAE